MSEWWTYRLEDFLLFSPRVYFRMIEAHNAALWPLQPVMIGIGTLVLLMTLRRPQQHQVAIALILAACWAFVGWSFLWGRYTSINWAAIYIALAFGLQSLALATWGLATQPASAPRGPGRLAALVLGAVGLFGYPFAASFFGRYWEGAEIFGISPDPTAAVTLAMLAMHGSRITMALSIIPLLSLLISGLTLQTMGEVQAWLPFSAALLAIGLIVPGQYGQRK